MYMYTYVHGTYILELCIYMYLHVIIHETNSWLLRHTFPLVSRKGGANALQDSPWIHP